MKKKSLILMFALTSLFYSCNDAIDINQPGQVTNPAEIYRTPKDVGRGVLGIYALLPGESEIAFDSVFTDEVALGFANGGQGLISGEYGFFMQPGNDFATSTWGSYYRVINQVNRLINSIDALLVDANPSDTTALRKSKAELLVLRAYSNYKLFVYFTPDYTNPSGLSIMKLDFLQTDDYSKVIGRSTVSEITDFILDDLTDAESLVQSAWESNIYVTQGLIDGIRVKLYSYVQDYPNVLTSAQNLLALNGTQMANATEYADYFNNVTDIPKEIIFQLQRVNGGPSVAAAWYSVNVGPGGSPFYEMGRSLYNELDKLDPLATDSLVTVGRNDVRYSVNVLAGSVANPNYDSVNQTEYVDTDILLIGKFKGRRSLGMPLQNNIPILRTADIYLAMAEARAGLGDINSTATTNNSLFSDGQAGNSVEGILFYLKGNRSFDRTGLVREPLTDAQSAWKAILDARRVEFAFEGHRYLDMKRLGVRAGSPGLQRYSKDALVNGTQAGLPADDYKLTLPIPTSELNSNSIIRGQQNPGY